ncbi:MAG: CoB--CoM heterodisulfide reductase iron-sulfur subunit A family protein [Candidatus Thermoplasmatota archaeon]|jgi:heterodisulfide reductase subunit A|nr:CoB--CoM heterodisulfide reductase iron-sulfur subunit A family protein [Candidatus Thermoplasmatota archaeon]
MTKKTDVVGSVAVVGGGIAGVQAALDLADMGFKVYVLEKTPTIGGIMAQLDKTFPTNDCSMCILSPKLVDCARHENIEIYTNAEVQSIAGNPGNFTLNVLKKPRYIDIEKCTSCGSCEAVCPISLPNAFEYGLTKRKAIYKPFPQAIPNAYVIDKEGDGKHRGCVDCMRCVKECKSGAINHDDKPEQLALNVGAVIIATGSQPFDPVIKPEFGYKKYKNVLTSIEFERVLSASGPTQGKIIRPSDQKHPKKVAWVHCVGSRDASINHDYCSAMCCMYTAKEAIIAKEHSADIEPTVFYIDVRSYGKDFDKYINRAKKEHGLKYIRSRISEIAEDPKTNDLIIKYEDDSGELKEEKFNLVVLSVGLCSAAEKRNELIDKLGLDVNEFGFVRTNPDDPVFLKPGIFAAGSFLEPQAIPESVMQASAAAANAAALLKDAKGTLVKEKQYPKERDVSNEEPRIGVFICHCGINIGGYLDVPELVKHTKSLKNVAFAEANIYTCSEDTQKKIVDAIKKHNLNRIIVAACTPRTHEPLFQKSLRDAGLNPYLLEMTNIREQCSWVHMDQSAKATEKAKKLIAMTVAKTRLLQPIQEAEIPVIQKALVLGGGIAGMTAALSLANQGYETALVEKEPMLGGYLHKVYYTVEGIDIPRILNEMTDKIQKHSKIKVYLSSYLETLKGYVGSYESKIKTPKEAINFSHGVVVVAIGADEYKPKSYHYGKDPRVLTQSELEKILSESTKNDIRDGEIFVMIQCVESRDDKRKYCSRICCMQAVKNAIKIKELNPKAEVFILYRDLMTYAFKEKFYKDAREKSVMFLQYDPEKKPEIDTKNIFAVKIYEPMLKETLKIPTDHLILSTGLQPNPDNPVVGKMLKVPVNDDGFFLEAHVKLRPVDFSTRGVFVAGNCHVPKFISESIYQAQAAAARAATILSKPQLKAEPNVAFVDEDLCSGCKMCIKVCPYNAIDSVQEEINEKMVMHAKVNEGLCQGCGTCVSTCPSGAIQQRGFKDKQILPMIDEIK